jgi:quercetin dioxygenase-like cupin family protein
MLRHVTRVVVDGTIAHERGSELELAPQRVAPGRTHDVDRPQADTLLLVTHGSGSLALDGRSHALTEGSAALVLAAETATVEAGPAELRFLEATIGPFVDRHAPIGPREIVVQAERVQEGSATGKRSFQVLFGPHNGCVRATLFMGHIPPGRAPWHYHLYDEIVWVPEGPGRLHLEGGVEELPAGAGFRLHPREVHVVENAGAAEMTVVGLFTPAGSPSAAYLPAGDEEGAGLDS